MWLVESVIRCHQIHPIYIHSIYIHSICIWSFRATRNGKMHLRLDFLSDRLYLIDTDELLEQHR